jgi:hypothetical protein
MRCYLKLVAIRWTELPKRHQVRLWLGMLFGTTVDLQYLESVGGESLVHGEVYD